MVPSKCPRKGHVPDREELLRTARSSPANLRFRQLCQLAECYGFVMKRQSGSHQVYVRPGWPRPMTFQDVKGMAKPYQVRQLLDAIDLIEQGQHDEPEE